jgi:hypothetical protein
VLLAIDHPQFAKLARRLWQGSGGFSRLNFQVNIRVNTTTAFAAALATLAALAIVAATIRRLSCNRRWWLHGGLGRWLADDVGACKSQC